MTPQLEHPAQMSCDITMAFTVQLHWVMNSENNRHKCMTCSNTHTQRDQLLESPGNKVLCHTWFSKDTSVESPFHLRGPLQGELFAGAFEDKDVLGKWGQICRTNWKQGKTLFLRVFQVFPAARAEPEHKHTLPSKLKQTTHTHTHTHTHITP